MRRKALIAAFAALALFAAGTDRASGSDSDGCMKISFDPFSLIGGSDKEGGERPERVDDRTDKERYTYNAMGQKVPVSTETEGRIPR